jgi:hypothetical protein
MKWSYFMAAKLDLDERVVAHVKAIKMKGIGEVRFIHCDNTGEN